MAPIRQPTTNFDSLPFDILTQIIPHLDLFDLARLRLVSKSWNRIFTSDDVCHFALKKLFDLTPESTVAGAGNTQLTRLIARTSRWMRKHPSHIDKFLVAKNSADPQFLGWGTAGNMLVYQTPSHADGDELDRSKLALHDLNDTGREIMVDLAKYSPLFDAINADEDNKWKIWIPRSADRGDKFMTGQRDVPKHMMVTSYPRSTETLQTGVNARRVSQRVKDFLLQRETNTPHTIHQAIAIVSLDPASLGRVVCHWTIEDEVRCFTVNDHYFAFSKKVSRHKYHVGFFKDIVKTWPKIYEPAENDAVKSTICTFAFPPTKDISALGGDISGRHLFVSFTSCVQIVDVKTGLSLKKSDLAMPPLRDTVSRDTLKMRFSFFQANESLTKDRSETHITVDLCCHVMYDEIRNDKIEHRQATALWKLHSVMKNEDSHVASLGWRPAFMSTPKVTTQQHLTVDLNSATVSSSRLHDCLALSTVRVNAEQWKAPRTRGSHAYHQQRGLPFISSIPTIVTNLYDVSIFEDEVDESFRPESAKSAKWLQPTSSVHVLSAAVENKKDDAAARIRSTKASLLSKAETKVPKPTVDGAPIVVGCGWVVFAKDRSDACGPLNLFGRIGHIKRADELVIVRFD